MRYIAYNEILMSCYTICLMEQSETSGSYCVEER